MSPAIDRIFRQALWEAHHRQCAYCGAPVRFKDLQIDHIIPRSSFQDSETRIETMQQFGLDEDFDFDGIRNKLPACSKCNRDKSSRVGQTVRVTHFLELALSKSGSVEDHAVKIQKEHSEDALQAALFVGLAQGIISREQIQDWLHGSDKRGLRFFLTKKLNLSETIQIEAICREDILGYLDVPLRSDASEAVVLHNDSGNSITANTLREYENAVKNGYYAVTNIEIKFCASQFEIPIQILRAVDIAVVPEESFIKNPKIAICDIEEISSSVLDSILVISEDLPDFPLGSTVKKLVYDSIINIEDVGQNHLHVESEYMGCIIEEVFRADFNDDGIEEILINYWFYAVGGTLGSGGTMILKKRSEDDLLSEDKEATEKLYSY